MFASHRLQGLVGISSFLNACICQFLLGIFSSVFELKCNKFEIDTNANLPLTLTLCNTISDAWNIVPAWIFADLLFYLSPIFTSPQSQPTLTQSNQPSQSQPTLNPIPNLPSAQSNQPPTSVPVLLYPTQPTTTVPANPHSIQDNPIPITHHSLFILTMSEVLQLQQCLYRDLLMKN